MKIQQRDPIHLKHKYSPALKRLPELPEDSPEFLAFCSGLKKAGFIRPILVDEHDQVVDDHSRTTLRAAIRWQMTEVPVQVCSSADAPMLLLHSLAHVRHLSKSAIAYLAVPNLQAALDAARNRMLENLRKNPTNAGVSAGDSEAQTVEELAIELGIGRNLVFEARKVIEAFADKKNYTFNVAGGAADGAVKECTLREWYEPKLLQPFTGGEHEQNRPMGLGGILAGITAVKEGNRDKFNPKAKGQLYLFESKALGVLGGWKYWGKLSETDRKKHFENFEQELEAMPEAHRDELADYYEKLAKRCRKASAA